MSGFLSKKERKDLLYELSLERNLPPQKNLWVPGGSGSFPRL